MRRIKIVTCLFYLGLCLNCFDLQEKQFRIYQFPRLSTVNILHADSLYQINLLDQAHQAFLDCNKTAISEYEKAFVEMRIQEISRYKASFYQDSFVPSIILDSIVRNEEEIIGLNLLRDYFHFDTLSHNQISLARQLLPHQPIPIKIKLGQLIGRFYHRDSFCLDSTFKYYGLCSDWIDSSEIRGLDYYWVNHELALVSKYFRKNNLGLAYANRIVHSKNLDFLSDSVLIGEAYAVRGYLVFRIHKYKEAMRDLDRSRELLTHHHDKLVYQHALRNQLQVIIFSDRQFDHRWNEVNNLLIKNISEYGDHINRQRTVGSFNYYRGKYNQAIVALELAFEHELQKSQFDVPVLSTILTLLCDSYRRVGRYNEAIAALMMDGTGAYRNNFDPNNWSRLLLPELLKQDYHFITLRSLAEVFYTRYLKLKSIGDLNSARKVIEVSNEIMPQQFKTLSEDALLELFQQRNAALDLTVKIYDSIYKTQPLSNLKEDIFKSIENASNALLISEVIQLRSEYSNDTLRELKSGVKRIQQNTQIFDEVLRLEAYMEENIESIDSMYSVLFNRSTDLSIVRDMLGQQSQVIYFVGLDTMILRFTISQDTTQFRMLLRNDYVEEAIKNLSRLTLPKGNENPNHFSRTSNDVYQYLFSGLALDKKVFVVKNRFAPFLNFELLCTDVATVRSFDSLPYAILKSQFINIPSVLFLEKILSNELSGKMLGVSFTSEHDSFRDLPRIDGGLREVKSMPTVHKLFGENATKKNFMSYYSDSSFTHFHISTHGISNSSNLDNVQVYFRKDGAIDTMYAYEVIETNSTAESIVLSICQVGSGVSTAIGDTYNFSRYFLINGAQYVVSSLWDQSDASASLVYINFYREFRGADLPIHLRKAKIELIHSRPAFAHPFYWGGIVVN